MTEEEIQSLEQEIEEYLDTLDCLHTSEQAAARKETDLFVQFLRQKY